MVLLIAACGDDGTTTSPAVTSVPEAPPSSPAPNAGGTSEPATTVSATIPPSLQRFGTATVEVGGREWLVAVAEEGDERVQGLRLIGDLGALDGMLFVYPDEAVRAFTMSTVPIPLDIGFFGADGVLDQVLRMEPCAQAEPECPTYEPGQPFRWAIETEVGAWQDVPIGAELELPG